MTLTFSIGASNPPCIGRQQLAPDGKIYFALINNPGTLAAVHYPNLAGTSCSVEPRAIVLVPQYTQALPNMPNDDLRNIGVVFSSSLTCRQASFQAPAHMQSQCAFSQPTPLWLKWDFGDPGSAGTNTSSVLNPTHLFTSTGTYTVRLVAQYNCYTDTFVKVVSVLNPGPTFTASGNFTICPGQKSVISLSGNYQFTWPGNQSGATMTLSPTSTTHYNVTATDSAGCSVSKLLQVTVSDCIGLPEGDFLNGVSVFPNPANEYLVIKSESTVVFELTDQLGRTVLPAAEFSGESSIDVKALPEGVYYAKVKFRGKSAVVKLIKSSNR